MKIKSLTDIEKESFEMLSELIFESRMEYTDKFQSVNFQNFKIEFKNYLNEQNDLFKEIQITDKFGFRFKYVYTQKYNGKYSRISLVIYDFNDINYETLHQRAINIMQTIKEKYNQEMSIKQYLKNICYLCPKKYRKGKEPVIIKTWQEECSGHCSGPFYIEGQTTDYREVEYFQKISLDDNIGLEYTRREVQKLTYGFDYDFINDRYSKIKEKIVIKDTNGFILAEWDNFSDINGLVIKMGYEDIVENTLLNTYIKILLNSVINRIVQVNSYVENGDIAASDIWYRFVKNGNSFKIIDPNDEILAYDGNSNLLSILDKQTEEIISPICSVRVEYLDSDESMCVEISPNNLSDDVDKEAILLYLKVINDNLNQESKFLDELSQLNSKVRECRRAKSKIKLPATPFKPNHNC